MSKKVITPAPIGCFHDYAVKKNDMVTNKEAIKWADVESFGDEWRVCFLCQKRGDQNPKVSVFLL